MSNLVDNENRKFIELADKKSAIRTMLASGFGIQNYDKVKFNYTTGNLTSIDFSVDGVVTSTLTFSYVGDDLDSVERTL